MHDSSRRPASRRGPSHIWSITYRNPDWPEDQGPVTKLFDDPAVLDRKLKRLRSSRRSRPPATIIKVERIGVSGQWVEVER